MSSTESCQKGLRGHRDLKVYQFAHSLAMQIFEESKAFPYEERYSLTSQIRRSSRSVAANIAEGFRKRQYPNMFISKLADSDAEATETQVWLDFARDCSYLSAERHDDLIARYEEVGRMLNAMIAHRERFVPSSRTESWNGQVETGKARRKVA
jgi:four helix bundle protein